jgi:hypothetical protein
MRGIRGIRLTSRRALFAILALGVLIEIAVAYVFLGQSGGGVKVVRTQGSLGGVGSTLPLHPLAGSFKPDATKLADCAEQTCYAQAFGNIAYYKGPKAAIALVSKRYGQGSDPNCHRIVHAIGAGSLARNKGNVARTFAEGSSICWSGYYHGVLERAFVDVKSYDPDELGAKSRGLCDDPKVRARTWLAYQCLHGLGHGLMITTGYQLPLSLQVCKQLVTDWDRTSCKGGVFMENILTSYGGQSPWVRDDDPLYPCDWVGREDKFTCYQQATTRILRVIGVDWAKTAEICATAERDFVSACFGSFGQNASVIASRHPRKIETTCAIARPYGGEAACIRYAAMDITGTYTGGKEAARLCDTSASDLRGTCYEAIGLVVRHLKSSPAARRAECDSISSVPRYVVQCIRGTTQKTSIPGLAR